MTTCRSDTLENYLKAIHELQEKHGRAKTSLLSERLGVTPGSVTDMLKRLAEQKPRLVSYQPHHGVVLTVRGRKKALTVIRRHRLLETFLHEVLGYAWDEVHAEAERLEHCLSDRLTEAIAAHLNDPACDPHGDPIPTRDGDMPQGLGRPLSALAVGASGSIVRVRLQEDAALQYLSQQGLEPGRTVTVMAKSPLDGQLSIQVRGPAENTVTALGLEVAAAIDVDPL